MKIFAVLLLCVLGWVPLAGAETITVSAAISLKETITQIGKVYQAQSGDTVSFNFGASGALAMQIAQGAPVDAFVSAATKQVKQLIADHKADPASERVVARNEIVLIIPGTADAFWLTQFGDLKNARISKIAIGQPESVPAGQYAVETLKSLKLMKVLEKKIIYAANVRQVLDYVVRNEVDAGIVYRTDAREAQSAVKVVATADPSTHEPIVYPAVIIRGCAHAAAARRFLDFLATPAALAIFTDQGFLPPTGAAAATQPARP